MNYKMKVTITDPNTKKGMVSELYFNLDCNLEVYDLDNSEETVYFVEVVGTKETSKKSKIFVNNDGRTGFRWGHWVVWLDECIRTNW